MDKVFYITFLRALGAVLITNSHYMGVYPTDMIANGGLLGDVLFFAVSGFCLCNVKLPFFKWYKRRIVRIYPPVIIITAVYLLLRFYDFDSHSLFYWFVFPTDYHFISSIIILYIPIYFLLKNSYTRNHLPQIFLVVAVIQLVIYLFFYDRSFYHIDTVREPMIRFLFLNAMLIGAYFNIAREKYMNRNRISGWILFALLLVAYGISKTVFVKYPSLSSYQIMNQYILLLLLFYFVRCFAGIDWALTALPAGIKKVVEFVAMITLEIYLVQYVIIGKFAYLVFPLNWITITALIVVSAYLLHLVSQMVIKQIERI